MINPQTINPPKLQSVSGSNAIAAPHHSLYLLC